MFVVVGLLLTILLVFAGIRVADDWPHILAGTPTDNDFAVRYIDHPWLGNLHMVLGILYLLGALVQLTPRIRNRHWTLHRRLGRILVPTAVLSGTFAVIFGILYPWGGPLESAAAVVFGTWFVTCLLMAFARIRRGDVVQHRRWMIRAFIIGLGVGTIRIWVGLFLAIHVITVGAQDMLPGHFTFGVAFWLGLSMHVAFAEWWLRRHPEPPLERPETA